MDEKELYVNLVRKRKSFAFSDGLFNPSQIENGKYDLGDHLGPWSAWQGNLDAKVLLLGQDWGDLKYYLDNKGKDTDDNPTNRNLIELFKVIKMDIGYPSKPNYSVPLFFTNSILGIKTFGGMSGKVRFAWVRESTHYFLLPLLNIINPQFIITLGSLAYYAIAYLYDLPFKSMKDLIEGDAIILKDGKFLYPRYHCGGLGLANRSLNKQKEDWRKIAIF